MKTVIRIVGSPLGDHTIADNRFVRAYSADGGGGHGTLETTEDIELALGFDDVAAALECWRAVSTTHPLRPDGKPNRPLTAYTVELANKP